MIANDLLRGAVVWMLCVAMDLLVRRFGNPSWRVRWRLAIIYAAALTAVWILGDLRLIPDWLRWVLAIAIVILFVFIDEGDDNDDDERRRPAVMRRRKRWLAHGVPATRPT